MLNENSASEDFDSALNVSPKSEIEAEDLSSASPITPKTLTSIMSAPNSVSVPEVVEGMRIGC